MEELVDEDAEVLSSISSILDFVKEIARSSIYLWLFVWQDAVTVSCVSKQALFFDKGG